MGALTIAFDTIIVGALALSWVLIVIHLFFFEGENRLLDVVGWATKQMTPAVAGIVLFALTYTLGSAVSRIASDFFNDDDLHFQFASYLVRVGMTQDRIVASVYCKMKHNEVLTLEAGKSAISEKIRTFETQQSKNTCLQILKWSLSRTDDKGDDDLVGTSRDLFGLEENALLLKGEDATLRLRQLHDQIMVLRGAGFNCLIGFSLCLFGWGAALRRGHSRSWWRFAVVAMPALYLAVAMLATVHHFEERFSTDPPYMEFTLILLAFAGVWLTWRTPRSGNKTGRDEAATRTKPSWIEAHWATLVLVFALLSLATILGWWSTQVLYAEQVVYSFESQGSLAAAQK